MASIVSLRMAGIACAGFVAAATLSGSVIAPLAEPVITEIEISPKIPHELNPPYDSSGNTGGATDATLSQAAIFAWQEFIALNWPAGPQQGNFGQRGAPSTTVKFGDPSYTGPLVWETMRSKVEIFPGNGNPPPGYQGSSAATSFGFDHLPEYNYAMQVSACNAAQANDPTPWINLDETDQILLNNMYAGVVEPDGEQPNSSPQLIRFLAKADRNEYVYVAKNSDPTAPFPAPIWWQAVPPDVVNATQAYLAQHKASPPPDMGATLVSLPYGTIELKAGWRQLNASERGSGRFHTQTVRYYEHDMGGSTCFVNATWGLVALHIIMKTPSAPSFIYATFEQADNILTADGKPVEDADGNIIATPVPASASTPQVCLHDPKPPNAPGKTGTSTLGNVLLTNDPTTCVAAPVNYCAAPQSQLYYRNEAAGPGQPSAPSGGNICVNRRDNAIPGEVIAANAAAHDAIAGYLKANGIPSSPWQHYKLINVQYHPVSKTITTPTPNGSLYTAAPPYSATNPAPSTYYLANIVVETNRSLQLFSGGLTNGGATGAIATDWDADGTEHGNTYYGGVHANMGGCMGCHGSQGQSTAGDFSVILARGSVFTPEVPSQETSQGLTAVKRNRRASKY